MQPTPAVATHEPVGVQAKEAVRGRSFAVIAAAGSQFKVTEDDVLMVNKLKDAEVGKEYIFNDVLLVGKMDATVIGRPRVAGARVVASVEEQTKDGKVIAFKKRRRKGYKRTKGFRREITVLRISAIEYPWEKLEMPSVGLLPEPPAVVQKELAAREAKHPRIPVTVMDVDDEIGETPEEEASV